MQPIKRWDKAGWMGMEISTSHIVKEKNHIFVYRLSSYSCTKLKNFKSMCMCVLSHK